MEQGWFVWKWVGTLWLALLYLYCDINEADGCFWYSIGWTVATLWDLRTVCRPIPPLMQESVDVPQVKLAKSRRTFTFARLILTRNLWFNDVGIGTVGRFWWVDTGGYFERVGRDFWEMGCRFRLLIVQCWLLNLNTAWCGVLQIHRTQVVLVTQ